MDPLTIAAIGGTLVSGALGAKNQKQGEKFQQKALEQSEYDYNMRAPLRRQGMQALGAVEGAYDLGNIGFNAANPFAAARGPAQSTAKIGGWDRMTTAPDAMDNAIIGVNDDDIAWAQDALNRKRPDGSFAYKASERNHAQKQIMDKANQRANLAGIQPLMQTRVSNARARNQQYKGFQPLGG